MKIFGYLIVKSVFKKRNARTLNLKFKIKMIQSVLAVSGVIFGILLIPTAAGKVDFGLEIPSAKSTQCQPHVKILPSNRHI